MTNEEFWAWIRTTLDLEIEKFFIEDRDFDADEEAINELIDLVLVRCDR